MATANLLPNGRQQFWDPTTGAFAVGGQVYTYAPGTTTPQSTWADGNQVTLNPNPITLDAQGSCSMFGTGTYKVAVYNALGTLIWTQDNIIVTTTSAIGSLVQASQGVSLSLTTNVPVDVTQIVLGPGGWDVYANATFQVAAGGAATQLYAGISETAATLPTSPNYAVDYRNLAASSLLNLNTPSLPLTLAAASTTIYLVADCIFTGGVGQVVVGGNLFARQRTL